MPRKQTKPHPTTAISQDEWKRLVDLAFRIRKLEPWEWMDETDLFGIQLAGAAEPAFISVMGAIGEHFAVGVYPSVAALNQFWEMQLASEDFPRPELLLETPQLQVVFGSAADLEPADKNLLKSLGHTPRGANAWPYFRSYRPGHLPWFIEPEEAPLLLAAMERLLDFAPRFDEDPDLLPADIGPDIPMPIQIQVGSGPNSAWQTIYRASPPKQIPLTLTVPAELFAAIRNQPRSDQQVEVDAPILPTPIGDPGERPILPYLLMAVDAESHLALGVEMMTIKTTIDDMWAQAPVRLLEILRKCGVNPAVIRVRNYLFEQLLGPICQKLDIELELAHELPALEELQQAMEAQLGGR